MAGMIWNANHVLDVALDPRTNGVPRDLFKACRGIVLISVVEAGFIFSGNVGTGVIMAKRKAGTAEGEGCWSSPSAIGLAGVGFGALVGGEIKDFIIFIMDDGTMDSFTGEAQLKMGVQLSLTLGPLGREAEVDINMSNKGVGGSVAYTFSRGLFAGAGIETALLGVRAGENERFYGRPMSPVEILYGDDAAVVAAAASEGTGIPDLHRKLGLLGRGETVDKPTPSELQRKESLREEAEREALKAREEGREDVVEVDAKDEAEKEERNEKTAWSALQAPDLRPDAAERVAERKEAEEKSKEKNEKTVMEVVQD